MKSKIIDGRTFIKKARTAISIIVNDNITLYSAQACYYIMISYYKGKSNILRTAQRYICCANAIFGTAERYACGAIYLRCDMPCGA